MSSFDAYGIDGEEEINVNASNSHFIDDEDEQSFAAAGEGYASYSSFPSGGFPADGDVAVDHASASPEIYEFDDPNPGYSQSSFNPIHMDNGNGTENGYGGFSENGIDIGIDDGVFSFDGSMVLPLTKMELEEGFALHEWRREHFSPFDLLFIYLFLCDLNSLIC